MHSRGAFCGSSVLLYFPLTGNFMSSSSVHTPFCLFLVFKMFYITSCHFLFLHFVNYGIAIVCVTCSCCMILYGMLLLHGLSSCNHPPRSLHNGPFCYSAALVAICFVLFYIPFCSTVGVLRIFSCILFCSELV